MNKGLIYASITAIFFATLEPVSKLIANQVDPYAVTFIRFFISSLLLMPFAIYTKKKYNIKLNITDHLRFCGLGILFVCVSMVILQMAVLKSSSPALIAIIFSSNSVMTIIMATIILREKLTAKKIFALVLCILGIAVCSWENFLKKVEIMPVILALVAALSFSVYAVLSKKTMARVKGSVVTGYTFLYGSIILLVFLLIGGGDIISGITMQNISILLYLGIFVTGVGYWAYFMAMEKSGATTASLSFFLKPILSPFVAFIINGENIKFEILIALFLVLAGSYLSSKQ